VIVAGEATDRCLEAEGWVLASACPYVEGFYEVGECSLFAPKEFLHWVIAIVH